MNQDADNKDKCQEHFSKQQIFKIALKARDFEIKMFWQRCNYFLLLNTSVGAAVGLTATSNLPYKYYIVPFLCAIGAFVCYAWIQVGLGAKFWQSYWEQVLVDFQEGVGFIANDEKDFFSQPKHANHIKRRVAENLDENTFYRCYVLDKPSVSRWMHKTALFFFLLWLFVLGVFSYFLFFCPFACPAN